MIFQQRDTEGLLCISFLHHWWQDFHWGIKYLPCLGTPVLWPPHEKSWLVGKDWCWEGLGAGGEGDDRGWDGWMASLTWWTWVWVNSGSWWWTGRPGVLQFMESQRFGHDWVTELNWTELMFRFAHASKWLSGFLQVSNSESVAMSGIETSSSA